mmetsp:Transcript_94922/g.273237  ORF Transcript_94922/g.273237 Transcript_94922/m.273237 type:complete len:246 (+) Transcript_94922:102-839(+)
MCVFGTAAPVALLVALLAGRALADYPAQHDAEAFATLAGAEADDECAGLGAEACAVSALQRKGAMLSVRQASSSQAPDFTFRSPEVEDEDVEVPEVTPQGAEALAQYERVDANWVEGVDKIAVTNCTGDGGNKCPDGETCVVKYDGTWSQCVDCSAEAFGRECQKLNDYMRYAAVHTCKRTCMDVKCYNQDWCLSPYKCIVDRTANWGQCVGCHDTKFWNYSCKKMTEEFLDAARKVCHKRCHAT